MKLFLIQKQVKLRDVNTVITIVVLTMFCFANPGFTADYFPTDEGLILEHQTNLKFSYYKDGKNRNYNYTTKSWPGGSSRLSTDPLETARHLLLF